MSVEARWRQLIVSSAHPSADERVAEAIARVLSRYAVDYASGVEVVMPHDGLQVPYQVAVHPLSLLSLRRRGQNREPDLEKPIKVNPAVTEARRAAEQAPREQAVAMDASAITVPQGTEAAARGEASPPAA
jgi:hypothetical protein